MSKTLDKNKDSLYIGLQNKPKKVVDGNGELLDVFDEITYNHNGKTLNGYYRIGGDNESYINVGYRQYNFIKGEWIKITDFTKVYKIK